MRIPGVVAPLLAAAALLTGCNPADAQKAQAILTQAQQASQSLSSESFIMKMTFSFEGKSAEIDMQGGAEVHSGQTGDFYLTMSGSIPDSTFPLNMTIVKRGGTISMRANGQTETLPVGTAEQQLGGSLNGITQLMDFARYVKGGSVTETDFPGRAADKLIGILDTQGLVSSAGGFSSKVFGQLGVHLGDVRVVLYVPRDTHLVEAMIADMTISAAGHSASMTMSFAVTSVNQPLTFPNL
jgi:hypothetical protein